MTAYGRARYLEALGNSLMLGLAAAGISVVLAVPMAWAVSRTDMPGKSIVWITVLGAFILPPFLGRSDGSSWPAPMPASSTSSGVGRRGCRRRW